MGCLSPDGIVSAPSGQITTVTSLQDEALDRLVNLYQGGGGVRIWKVASLNCWSVLEGRNAQTIDFDHDGGQDIYG